MGEPCARYDPERPFQRGPGPGDRGAGIGQRGVQVSHHKPGGSPGIFLFLNATKENSQRPSLSSRSPLQCDPGRPDLPVDKIRHFPPVHRKGKTGGGQGVLTGNPERGT